MRKIWGVLLGGVALVLSGPASAAFLSGGDISCESSTDSGTTTIDLDGAYGNYLPFSTFAADGDTFDYHLRTGTGLSAEFETGTATFHDGTPDTMDRVADWSSDGAGAELNLAASSVICIAFTTKFFTGGIATLDIEALDVDAAIVAGTNITATAGDLTSGDDVLVGDDVALSAVDGVISIGADVTFTRVDASDSLVIQADVDNSEAATVISLGVDGSGEALLSGTAFYPGADGGNALGITNTNEWAGVFLNTGATINYENGDCIWTHASNSLALTGGCLLSSDAGLELSGNASATITTSGANLLIESVIAKRVGVETIWIPANAISPVTDTYGQCQYSVPATFGGVDLALASCLYNDAAYDIGSFTLRMPKNWDEGTYTYQVYWGTSATSGDVSWKLNCYSYSENEALAAWSSTAEVNDTAMGTANRLAITAASSALTCNGTVAVGDVMTFRFYRDYADSGDTIAADVRLWGVLISYTSDAANDD
jgi:hypothetical protein